MMGGTDVVSTLLEVSVSVAEDGKEVANTVV